MRRHLELWEKLDSRRAKAHSNKAQGGGSKAQKAARESAALAPSISLDCPHLYSVLSPDIQPPVAPSIDTGCGDIMQDRDSFCGPSFKLRHLTPLCKARRRINTCLPTEDSGENNDADDDNDNKGKKATSVSMDLRTFNSAARRKKQEAADIAADNFSSECSYRSSLTAASLVRRLPKLHKTLPMARQVADPVSDRPQQSQEPLDRRGEAGENASLSQWSENCKDRQTAGRQEQPYRQAAAENCKNDEEEPIDYMEVYHRMRMGRFGCLYDFPYIKASTARTSAADARLQQLRLNSSDRDDDQVTAASSASAAGRISDEASGTRRKSLSRDKLGTHLTRLFQLLRDNGGQRGHLDDAVSIAGPQSPPSLSPSPLLPPVPKPRPSITRTARPRRVASPRQDAIQQALLARPVSDPSTSSAVAEPFGPPRRCCLTKTLVNVAEPVQHLSYLCADCEILQRLSITAHLMGKLDGAVPCRWLGSSALLTHLRLSRCTEVAGQSLAAPAATVVVVRVQYCPSLVTACSCQSPLVRFAFHTMSKRRSSHNRRIRSGTEKSPTGKPTRSTCAVATVP